MQYESILLELMSRIKTLEKEQIVLQEKVDALMNPSCKDFSFQESEVSENVHPGPKSYLKMTEEMMEMCYMAGKKLYSDEKLNIGILADEITTKTGRNRSSAVMYIYVVDCMLKGNVYKRAISTKATEKYFKEIYEEYGKSGLCNALQATREHIRYRKNLGHTVEGLVTLCVQYEMYLD